MATMEEREGKNVLSPMGKKGAFYTPNHQNDRWQEKSRCRLRPDNPGRIFPKIRPLYWASRIGAAKQLKNHFSGRIIRPYQTGLSGPVRNSKTETAITFASGLRFWWSWARFEEGNELYKIMQRTIIVNQERLSKWVTWPYRSKRAQTFAFLAYHLSWFLSIWGFWSCVNLHDKLKFIENGSHLHSLLRFRY